MTASDLPLKRADLLAATLRADCAAAMVGQLWPPDPTGTVTCRKCKCTGKAEACSLSLRRGGTPALLFRVIFHSMLARTS
jgi:hypothetical protein